MLFLNLINVVWYNHLTLEMNLHKCSIKSSKILYPSRSMSGCKLLRETIRKVAKIRELSQIYLYCFAAKTLMNAIADL